MRLKISIREVVTKEEEISAQFAAEIMYHEYIKHDSAFFKMVCGFDIKTLKCHKEKWSIQKVCETTSRPATPDEIKAYHRRELNKHCLFEPCPETEEMLKGKEIILEII
ncbi:MAG: hypothetical protein WC096_02665 [Sphaerochaetaceae bacterium]